MLEKYLKDLEAGTALSHVEKLKKKGTNLTQTDFMFNGKDVYEKIKDLKLNKIC